MAQSVQMQSPNTSSFDFDDAFSDGDADEMTYRFSPNTLREDLARNMPAIEKSWSEAKDSAAPSEPSEVPSTFASDPATDGKDPVLRSRSRSPPRTPSPSESPTTSAYFSQISLSVSDDISKDTDQVSTNGTIALDDNPYPNIIIDASNGTPPYRVSSASDPHAYTTENNSGPPSSFPSLELPPNTAQSTQSLPTPTSHPARFPQQSNTATPTPSSSPSPSPSASTFEDTSLPSSSSAPQSQLSPPQKPFKHRPTRSTGPSAFEKVRSKTRPMFLPPKPRQEDDKHMADWESMMRLSRANGMHVLYHEFCPRLSCTATS